MEERRRREVLDIRLRPGPEERPAMPFPRYVLYISLLFARLE
jgi:hypothetical protein